VIKPHFTRNENLNSEVLLDKRLDAALHKEENFQPDQMQPADQQSKLGLSFMCDFDPAASPYESFCMQILSNLLLEGPNSPFYKSVIDSGLAPGFCPGSGFDYTTRQPTFTIGV